MKLLRKDKPTIHPLRQVSSPERPKAFSYYEMRSAEPGMTGRQIFREAISARTARRAASYWGRRFGLLIVLLVAVIAFFSILTVNPDPKVIPNDNGRQVVYLHSTATYERAAQSWLEQSPLSRTKLTLDTGALAAALQREYPELSNVSVSLPLIGHRPVIYISAVRPAVVLVNKSGAYVIDQNGRDEGGVDGKTPESLGLVPVRDESDAPVHLGQLALSAQTVAFMQVLYYQVQQKNLTVTTFVLPATTSELDMYLGGLTYYARFNLADNSPLQQVGTFLATKHYLEGQGIVPTAYIDARIVGRAYYK